jgi:hypothetical protein
MRATRASGIFEVPTSVLAAPSASTALNLTAHDHEQIEVQHTHDLLPKTRARPIDLELYFFIPRNVGVRADNYPREEFYGDLTHYMRLDLPDLALAELADDHRGRSPLVALNAQLDAVSKGKQRLPPIGVEVKLFGHIFTEATRDRTTLLLEQLATLPNRPVEEHWRYLDEVDRFAGEARAALCALRRAERRVEPYAQALRVQSVFRTTDEYASLFLDGALALLAERAREETRLYDGSGFVTRLGQVLARHADAESLYRRRAGFLNLDLRAGASEYFAYRQSFLKKAVQQALYVESGRLENDRFIRNAASMVGASLAAVWALVAQLPQDVAHLSPLAQTAVLGLPIAAYVAKDRIKELTRDWMTRRIRGYDNQIEIRAGALAEAGLGRVSGQIQETSKFIESVSVPDEVTRMRVALRTVRNADTAGETVLYYHRHLDLSTGEGGPATEGLAFRQILRLNLRHFLTRLDEPEQHESHFAVDEGRFVRVALPKVYHINLIARVRAGGRRILLKRWRIVLNKAGIVRLETALAEE